MSALPTIPRAMERELRARAEQLVEWRRQRKVIEEQEEALKAQTLEDLDTWGLASWSDDFFVIAIVEKDGRRSADVAALLAAGLGQYIRAGTPSRYVEAKRK